MSKIDLKYPMRGEFTTRVICAKTGVVKDEKTFPNTLTTLFFERALNINASNSDAFSGFMAGSGSSEPLETDQQLDARVGYAAVFPAASTVEINYETLPRYKKQSVTMRGGEGAIVGNISELAIYGGNPNPDAPTAYMASRALVRDASGTPTSITVLSDEFLEITWSIYIYMWDSVTGVLNINIDGVLEEFNYEIRPVRMNSALFLGTSTGTGIDYPPHVSTATGGNVRCCYVSEQDEFVSVGDSTNTSAPHADRFTSVTQGVYNPASRSREFTIRLALDRGNKPGGFRSIFLYMNRGASDSSWFKTAHQMLLDRPVPKNAERLFDLPIVISLSNGTVPEA